jgi:hypothetical protein
MAKGEDKAVVEDPVCANRPPVMTLEACLETLLATRADADFEIAIDGENEPIPVHFFVLYARWPYFRHMFDSALRNREERRLVLPASNTDNGIQKHILDVIIKFLYSNTDPSDSDLDGSGALQLLEVSGLYLSRDEEPELFKSLISWASERVNEVMTLYDAVEVFSIAAPLRLDQVASCAKDLIVENIERLMNNEQRSRELKSLPSDLLFDLFKDALKRGTMLPKSRQKPSGRFGIRNVLYRVSDEDETFDVGSDSEKAAPSAVIQTEITAASSTQSQPSTSWTAKDGVGAPHLSDRTFSFNATSVPVPPGGFNFRPTHHQQPQTSQICAVADRSVPQFGVVGSAFAPPRDSTPSFALGFGGSANPSYAPARSLTGSLGFGAPTASPFVPAQSSTPSFGIAFGGGQQAAPSPTPFTSLLPPIIQNNGFGNKIGENRLSASVGAYYPSPSGFRSETPGPFGAAPSHPFGLHGAW